MQERRLKGIGSQMLLEAVGQIRRFGNGMVVADGTTSLLPNLLLGVEVRSRHRIVDNLQAGISLQELTDWLTVVPRRAVPQQQNRTLWNGFRISSRCWALAWAVKAGERLTSS